MTKEIIKQYIDEISEKLKDQYHRRLIQAYDKEKPLISLESELEKILLEVMSSEDQ